MITQIIDDLYPKMIFSQNWMDTQRGVLDAGGRWTDAKYDEERCPRGGSQTVFP